MQVVFWVLDMCEFGAKIYSHSRNSNLVSRLMENTAMIGVIDYGMGNLRSVQKAFEHQGCEVQVTSDRNILEQADGIVFPGQGAFKDAMKNISDCGLTDFLRVWVEADRPFLGICLGLQLLFAQSEESGDIPGLGLVKGRVKRFPPVEKVPQMGWNSVQITEHGRSCPLLKGINDGEYFYFVHSYYVEPEHSDVIALETEYSLTYTSMIWRKNLYAVQFHPEKSQEAGLKMISNFKEIVEQLK